MKYHSKRFLALMLSVAMALTPASGTLAESVSPAVLVGAAEKATEAETEKTTEKAAEPAAEKVTEKATEKAEEPVTEKTTEKAAETEQEKGTEAAETAPEKETEATEEPAAEKTAEEAETTVENTESGNETEKQETETEAQSTEDESETEAAETMTEAAESESESETESETEESIVLETIETETLEEESLASGTETSVPATEITLNAAEKTIAPGDSFELSAIITPADTTDLLTWSSSNEQVVKVEDGKVTALSVGSAVVKAVAGEVFAECNVTVEEKVEKEEKVSTYSIAVTSVMNETGEASGMYAMGDAVATEQTDGTWLVRMQQTKKNRNYMALTSDKDAATKHSVDWYVSDADYYFTIPVSDLTQPLLVSFSSASRAEEGKEFSNIVKLTFDAANMTENAEAKAASASDISILPAVQEEVKEVTYSIAVTSVMNETGEASGMYAMGDAVATEQTDGTWLVRMQQTKKNRNYMALTSDKDAATKHSVDWYVSDADYYFTIPVSDLTQPLLVSFSSASRAEEGKEFSNIVKLTFDAANMTENAEAKAASASDISILPAVQEEVKELADYTEVDNVIASVPTDLSGYTDETVNALNAAVNAVVRGYEKEKQSEVDKMAEDIKTAISNLKEKETTVPDEDDVPEDGDYQTTASTNSNMFKVVDVKLTIVNGKMQALITLSGVGYDYLFMGTGAEANNAGKNEYIPEQGRADYISEAGEKKTGSCFIIPVAELDVPIAVASHSISNDKWYDRTITFSSENLEKIGGDNGENGDIPSDDDTETETEKETEKENGKETEKENDKTADKESKYESDTSGSTSAVDSSTGLKDGVYTPDKFSWSGGSGRTSISCSKVTVSGGQAYATIVFSSSNYGYVKANGRKYYATYGAGTSSFTIPVKLNANNRIIGMTTAMSAAHEITYTIYVYIAGADAAANSKDKELSKDGLSQETPEIIGLTYSDEEELEHAEYFKMFHYDQGITMIEVLLKKDTDNTNEEDTETEETEEDAEEKDAATLIADLYQENVVRYLVVPETAEIPIGLEKEMIVVYVPVESVYTDSEQALETLEKLGLKDLVTVQGETAEKPEYKELVLNKCDLAVLSGEFLSEEEKEDRSAEEQKELFREVIERLTTLGIPVVLDRSAEEETVEAAAEWLKLYGVLFGCEEAADALYQEMIQR